jgi:hypothetical protein
MKHKIGNIYRTNRDGDAEIIAKGPGKIVRVKFLNTGFERDVNIDNLVAGKCKDYSITERKYVETEYPCTRMTSNNSGDFILLEKEGKRCIVQFIETGYTTSALWENIKVGKIRDPYFKSNYGVACMGEYKKTPYSKQAFQLWHNVIKRCYSDKDLKGYKKYGVTVDDRWLCFANFLEDLPQLENFSLWLEGGKEGREKYNLDKDFIVPGNKVYSREVCMFLPESLNKAFTSRTKLDK